MSMVSNRIVSASAFSGRANVARVKVTNPAQRQNQIARFITPSSIARADRQCPRTCLVDEASRRAGSIAFRD
jgi:hypothetical protein